MKGIASFADLLMNLFIASTVIMVLIFTKVNADHQTQVQQLEQKAQEYLQTIELLKRKIDHREPASLLPGESDLVLSITRDSHFVLEKGTGGAREEMSEIAQLKKVLAQRRPGKLYLRVDQSVPTGTTQAILADCDELGIMGFLVLGTKGA